MDLFKLLNCFYLTLTGLLSKTEAYLESSRAELSATETRELFSHESTILDVRLDSKYAHGFGHIY